MLVFGWAMATIHEELCKEAAELSLEKHGLHFKAASATVEQLETTFMWKSITFDSSILIFLNYFYTIVR